MYIDDLIALPWRVMMALERSALRAWPWSSPPAQIDVAPGHAEITLGALGDMYLDQVVGQPPEWVYGPIFPLLQSCDIGTCNLESPFTHDSPAAGTIGNFHQANPAAVRTLKEGGIRVVTVANNHALDRGYQGFADTIDHLASVGIGACGSAAADNHSRLLALNIRGIRIGFLGWCDDHYPIADRQNELGPATLAPEKMETTIRTARKQLDLLVVQLHWGYEFSLHPLHEYRDLARRLIEWGADLVLCHHAHVIQGLERWQHGAIAYGLGNAVMPPNPHMQEGHHWTNRSFFLQVGLSREGVKWLRLHPFAIGQAGQLSSLPERDHQSLLDAAHRVSARLTDDSFLRRCEQQSTVVEGSQLLEGLQAAHRQSGGSLIERIRALRLPRQQRMISRMHAIAPAASERLRALSMAEVSPTMADAAYSAAADTIREGGIRLRKAYSNFAGFAARVP